MRILQVVHGFPPVSNAGTEKYTYYLSKELANRHEVHVLYPSATGTYLTIGSYHDGVLHRHELCVSKSSMGVIKATKAFIHFENTYFNPEVHRIFKDFVQHLQPDIIHFQHLIYLSVGLIDVAVSLGIANVLTLHDYWFTCPTLNLVKHTDELCDGPEARVCRECWTSKVSPPLFSNYHLSGLLTKTLLKLFNNDAKFDYRKKYMLETLSKVDKIIAPSSFLYNLFLKAGIPSDNIVHIENGYDYELFDTTRSHRQTEDRIVFGFVGRITPIKGLHTLVDAFLRVPSGCAELRIYGGYKRGDKYVEDLFRNINGRQDIKFMDFVPDTNSIYSSLDVLVFPSLWYENCPLTLAESQIRQIPVIASNIGAIPEFVQEGINGFLFEPGNADNLHDCIMQLISNPQLLNQLEITSASYPATIQEHALNIEQFIYNYK